MEETKNSKMHFSLEFNIQVLHRNENWLTKSKLHFILVIHVILMLHPYLYV